MELNSSKVLFMATFYSGIMLSISSNNWIMIWCGLEISLISIMPLMISKSMNSSEAMMKYFIVQSISSSVLMLGLMTMVMKGDYNYSFILTTALLIKMGVAPFHNWILTVVENIEFYMVLIMLSVNKIAPMTLMGYLDENLMMIIFITAMAGSILGLNQTSIKKMLGYSSIFNMSFMLTVIKYSLMWMLYLIFYSLLISYLMVYANKNKMMFINQMTLSELTINKMSLWMNMLSMGGMPPMMGFSIKYMVLTQMIKSNLIFMLITLILTSLLVMWYYLRITFTSLLMNSMIQKTKLIKINKMSAWMMLLNLMMMPSILISLNI